MLVAVIEHIRCPARTATPSDIPLANLTLPDVGATTSYESPCAGSISPDTFITLLNGAGSTFSVLTPYF